MLYLYSEHKTKGMKVVIGEIYEIKNKSPYHVFDIGEKVKVLRGDDAKNMYNSASSQLVYICKSETDGHEQALTAKELLT